jgi:hypothetical protein
MEETGEIPLVVRRITLTKSMLIQVENYSLFHTQHSDVMCKQMEANTGGRGDGGESDSP